jgi:hypothetical protein
MGNMKVVDDIIPIISIRVKIMRMKVMMNSETYLTAFVVCVRPEGQSIAHPRHLLHAHAYSMPYGRV